MNERQQPVVITPEMRAMMPGPRTDFDRIAAQLRRNAIALRLDMYALGERAPDWGAELDPGRKNWQTHTPNTGPITRKE